MDDSKNVRVRFIEPVGKLPKRKEIRFEEFYESGSDKSDPYKEFTSTPLKMG